MKEMLRPGLEGVGLSHTAATPPGLTLEIRTRGFVAAALACAAFAAAFPATAQKAPAPRAEVTEVSIAQLPPETRITMALIRKGGPYPYARDGAIFANREGALPRQRRGYYREYTVKTPGERTRGVRRIVWGAGGEFYYTDDHYNHFRRIRE